MTARSRGFTLLETLLALVLIVLLFGAMYTFSSQVAATRKALQADASRHRSLTDVFDSIERAALTSLAGDHALGAGVVSTPTSISIVHRQGGRLTRDTWKFDEAAGTIIFTQRPLDLEAPSSSPSEAPATENWVEGVLAVRVRFLKDRLWTDSFDSLASAGLPDAIEVSIWLASSADRAPATQTSSGLAETSAPLLQRPPDRQRLIPLDPPSGGPQ